MGDSNIAELVAKLEARIRLLEDEKAIIDLFHKWHYACTGGFAGKQAGRMEALECLTDDATIEMLGVFAPGEGPQGIVEFTEFWKYFEGDDGPLPFVFQTSVSDHVEITGDTGEHKTVMLGMFQFRQNSELQPPTIGLAQRTNFVRRTPQGWRIYKTTIEGGFTTRTNEFQGNLNKLPAQDVDRKPFQKHIRSAAI